MKETVISVENISKLYRLGEVGTGTLSHDLNRWWHRVRGKEDPYLKIGQSNDRTKKADSDYVWALKDVSFEVERGEVLGIIGRNGAGKSTLLKILSRVTTPTSGEIKVKGRIASLLEVGTGFNPELTGRDNIYLNGSIMGMRKYEIDNKFDEIVEFAGVERYIDTPVKRYSSGMYVRLAFAVAAHLEPEILIIDEVLAVGDSQFQTKCLGKMRDVSNGGRTVLFVSHNMSAIQTLCKSCIILEDGRLKCSTPAEEAVLVYSESTQMVSSVKFPLNPGRPSISHVVVDHDLLAKGDLIVEIGFKSPFPLNPPVGGLVLSSTVGTPVFGTNPRFHNQGFGRPNLCEGTLRMSAINLPVHGGTYRLSVWLGDWQTDYDEKRDALAFDFKSGARASNTPPPEQIGFTDTHVRWSVVS